MGGGRRREYDTATARAERLIAEVYREAVAGESHDPTDSDDRGGGDGA